MAQSLREARSCFAARRDAPPRGMARLHLRPEDIPSLGSALAAAHELLHLASWLETAEADIIRSQSADGGIDSDTEQDMIGTRMHSVLIEFVERFDRNFDAFNNPYYTVLGGPQCIHHAVWSDTEFGV